MRRGIFDRAVVGTGLGSLLAGVVLLLAPSVDLAQTHAATKSAPPTAPSCAHQRNLHDPTNSNDPHDRALSGYWFAVEHQGHTIAVCTLLGNVHAGDIVTAHFTLASTAPAGLEVTLVSNEAGTTSLHHQNLFACASYTAAADPTIAGDACVASNALSLTVNVPACNFQVDLIYGEPTTPLVQGQYFQQHRWIDGDLGKTQSTCVTPTPTPTQSGGGGGGVSGASSTPGGGGVQGIGTTVPATGVGDYAPLALLLLALGTGTIVWAARGRRAELP